MKARFLLAFLLAGCAGPTPAPAPLPTVASPTPSPEVTPSFPPRTGPIPSAELRGSVFDEAGQPLATGTVFIRSLNPSNPYEGEEPIQNGAYAAEHLPAGVQLEVTARRPGFTPRTRLITLVPDQDNTLSFGTPLDAFDPEVSPYFLSNHPEVTAVEPIPDARLASATTLTYKLTLSEPLDAANRRRFEQAFRLLPVNGAASGGVSGGASYTGEAPVSTSVDTFAYAIRVGTTLATDPDGLATMRWDEEGRVATFVFPAPLLRSRSESARYQVALVAGGDRIVDGEGHPLGTNLDGSRDRYPAQSGQVIHHAFRDPDMRLSEADFKASAERRWAALHSHGAGFEVEADREAPTLLSIAGRISRSETRLTLRFDEPLVAYDGTETGKRDAQLFDWSRYTFAVAGSEEAAAGVDLDVAAPFALDTATTGYAQREAFRLVESAEAKIRAELDPRDPAVVTVRIANGALFDPDVDYIRVRVEGVSDPAGNAIRASRADDNVRVGRLERL